MRCPVCDEARLMMTERNGVEIDYCPDCRGVWLDRGELDKLIDRAAAAEPRQGRAKRQPDEDEDGHEREGLPDGGRRAPRRRRESFLGEMFDFGG